uniref:Uncharacterized protein n=1 Tax=Pipistrellus kuhlii TaxID=59472 RepID=A0A7J7YX32_PIPKU|nr:hypothetical protein mPipKuh1_009907 [Pipistrellus kuhlii]
MLGKGKHSTDSERTHEGLLLLPGGARNGFTEEVMGMTALKGFHEGRRQLEQNHHQHLSEMHRSGWAIIVSSCICLPHQTGSSWKVIFLPKPSSVKLSLGGRNGERRVGVGALAAAKNPWAPKATGPLTLRQRQEAELVGFAAYTRQWT